MDYALASCECAKVTERMHCKALLRPEFFHVSVDLRAFRVLLRATSRKVDAITLLLTDLNETIVCGRMVPVPRGNDGVLLGAQRNEVREDLGLQGLLESREGQRRIYSWNLFVLNRGESFEYQASVKTRHPCTLP